MLRYCVSAALLVAAPALAQSPPPAPPSPPAAPAPQSAIQTAAMAFGQCVSSGIQSVDSAVTPEAGAANVIGGCATQRDQLVQAAEAMIATMPADQQAGAHEQLRTRLGEAETHIAEAIRQRRSAPAPSPLPAQ